MYTMVVKRLGKKIIKFRKDKTHVKSREIISNKKVTTLKVNYLQFEYKLTSLDAHIDVQVHNKHPRDK